MQANELMLGDWVFSKSISAPAKIIAIEPCEGLGPREGFTYVLSANKNVLYVHARSVSPIALTPEILEKNGFKRYEGDMYFPSPRYLWVGKNKEGVIIQVCFYEKPVNGVKVLTKITTPCASHGGVNSVHNCDIEYVHELQNAIRLCRIEKEIIL